MKIFLCVFLILFIFFVAGCNDNYELTERIEEQINYIDELQQILENQADTIANLQLTIEEEEALQQEHLDTILQLQTEIEASLPSDNYQFRSGLTESEIRDSFFQNGEALIREAVGDFRDIELIIRERTVIGLVPYTRRVADTFVVFLRYRRESDEIFWEVTGYGVIYFRDQSDNFFEISQPHIIPAREPATPRQLTELETVTLPFFYDFHNHDSGYIEEVIQGDKLWEETIRLVREYYKVQVRDLWYEGSILYVEMMPIMVNCFNTGFGSFRHGLNVRRTFEAFPDITDVRILVLGRRFTIGYNGFDINCVPPCPGKHGWWWVETNGDPPVHTCTW